MTTYLNIKVRGTLAKALIASLRFDELHQRILEQYAPGLLELSDSDWYPVANIVTALQKLIEARHSFDSTFDMVAIGVAGAQHAPVPEGTTLEAFLVGQPAMIEQLYDGNYEIHSTAEKIGPNHYRIEVDPPWPYDLMYGTYYGFAKRLLPEGSTFTLHKAEKDQGDQRPMVFEIEWT